MLGRPRRGGVRVFDRGREPVLRRETVIDVHHDRVGASAQRACHRIVRVDVTQDESTAVEVHNDRQQFVLPSGSRPVDPHRYRAAWRVEAPVLDSMNIGFRTGELEAGGFRVRACLGQRKLVCRRTACGVEQVEELSGRGVRTHGEP
jgi:hypothetical protein